jgi:alcohol dehydrogenase class IV
MPSASELRANIAFPTRYRFGWGRRAEVGAEAKVAGIARALVVSDPGVAALPWFAAVVATIEAPVVFAALSSNPTEAEIVAGVAAYRAHGASGVIAIGGGSAMDAGKAIALCAGHDGAPAEFALGGARARQIRADQVAPIVCVPTTAGTGSELSTGAVVTDPVAGIKRTMLHAALLPRAVVADPETTVGLPAKLTAATGMDALTHALEALCAPGYHPMCDAIALEALRMIATHLPRAVAHPDDAEARSHLLMASSMAAVAFQKGLGLTHAMAHPLGAVTGLHHGLANALLLPHVLTMNAPAIFEPCARLCHVLHLRDADPVATIHQWVVELVDQLGLPTRAPVPGDEALIARLVPLAQAEKLYLATNPRPTSADEIAAIYGAVLLSSPSGRGR